MSEPTTRQSTDLTAPPPVRISLVDGDESAPVTIWAGSPDNPRGTCHIDETGTIHLDGKPAEDPYQEVRNWVARIYQSAHATALVLEYTAGEHAEVYPADHWPALMVTTR